MNSWMDEESEHTVAPWPGGQGGPHLLLRPVGKLSMLSEIVNVVGNCQSCRWGGGGIKMLLPFRQSNNTCLRLPQEV